VSFFAPDDLTRNAFLGGRVHLLQPRAGYRAGVDPVFLAASVPGRAGQSVLELGCGAGAASLCLAARVPGLAITGVEVQADYADLARQNAAQNNVAMQVFNADLTALPEVLRQSIFDHVIANPPYYQSGAHSPSQDAGRRAALGEDTPLVKWIDVAAKRLAPKGYLHVIQRTDRLPDLLAACAGRLGSLEVLPLAARRGRAPDLMILRARKSGRAAFILHAPVILHEGDRHETDGESYSPEITEVLRTGAALCWPAHR
jgi:tRNA1(Val) A37 N6-methylase TrmN6